MMLKRGPTELVSAAGAVVVAAVTMLAGCGSSEKKGAPDTGAAGAGTAGSGAAGAGGGGAGGGAAGAGGSGGGAGGGGAGGGAGSVGVDAGAPPDGAPPRDTGAIPDAPGPRDGGASLDGPVQVGGGFVLPLVEQSAGMNVATDASGGMHVAALAVVDASGKYGVVYARCAGRCSEPGTWSAVALAEASTGHVPAIALTQDGRPRIAYYFGGGSAPGLHYLECDSGCTTAASWKDVRLANNSLAVTPFPRPSLPFAVSPGGSAAFAFDDGTGLQLVLCKSNCGSGASWSQGTIGPVFVVPESLAFSGENLQIVARQRMQDIESLVLLDCSSDCTAAASWDGVVGLWRISGVIEALLARTAQGGSRIVLYADDPTTPKNERIFALLACDSQCRTPASWKTPLLLPIRADAAEVGYAMTLDGGGRPVLAFADLSGSAVVRCTGDCTTPAGLWQTAPVLAAADLDRAYPVLPPISCVSGSWSMYTGPALAVGAGDKAIVGLTAGSKAFGGQCGTGSSFITTTSFLAVPP
jgi:hypothetical protein